MLVFVMLVVVVSITVMAMVVVVARPITSLMINLSARHLAAGIWRVDQRCALEPFFGFLDQGCLVVCPSAVFESEQVVGGRRENQIDLIAIQCYLQFGMTMLVSSRIVAGIRAKGHQSTAGSQKYGVEF